MLVNTQSRSTYNLHRKQNLLPSEQTSNVEHLIWRTTNKCFNKQGMGTNDISECDIWLNHSRQNFFVVCGKLLSTPEVFILPFLLSPRRCLELLRVLLWFQHPPDHSPIFWYFVSSFILIGHNLQNIKPLTIEQTLDSGNEINARRGLHNHIQIDTQLRVFVTIVHCAFSCWKHRKNCECSPGHSLIVNY